MIILFKNIIPTNIPVTTSILFLLRFTYDVAATKRWTQPINGSSHDANKDILGLQWIFQLYCSPDPQWFLEHTCGYTGQPPGVNVLNWTFVSRLGVLEKVRLLLRDNRIIQSTNQIQYLENMFNPLKSDMKTLPPHNWNIAEGTGSTYCMRRHFRDSYVHIHILYTVKI